MSCAKLTGLNLLFGTAEKWRITNQSAATRTAGGVILARPADIRMALDPAPILEAEPTSNRTFQLKTYETQGINPAKQYYKWQLIDIGAAADKRVFAQGIAARTLEPNKAIEQVDGSDPEVAKFISHVLEPLLTITLGQAASAPSPSQRPVEQILAPNLVHES